MDYQNIKKYGHKLSMLDLTNQNYLRDLVQELKAEATGVCNRHMKYHCEYCDCKKYDREIELIKIIITKRESLIEK